MTGASSLVRAAFAALDAAGVRHCLLRGPVWPAVQDEASDVDILVAAAELPQAERALSPLGFAARRAWGHAPHRFLVAEADGALRVKLDLVTALCFGRPIRHLEVDLASRCLASRRRLDSTWVPSPEDEFAALLLHALLDKPDLSSTHRLRLTALWGEVGAFGGRDEVEALVMRCTGGGVPPEVLERALDWQDWDVLRARRARVARRIFWAAPARATWRLARGYAGRRAASLLRAAPGGLHG